MSYCRFSEGDVYMYEHVDGGIECCACSIAKKIPSIFTKGVTKKDGIFYKLFGKIKPCKKCNGKGCSSCHLPDNTHLKSYEEALAHLYKHEKKGDQIPKRAFERLKEQIKLSRNT